MSVTPSVPDPPTDLWAVNVTDTKALLLWRPALAAIDKYAIVYGSGTGKCWCSCVSVVKTCFFLLTCSCVPAAL